MVVVVVDRDGRVVVDGFNVVVVVVVPIVVVVVFGSGASVVVVEDPRSGHLVRQAPNALLHFSTTALHAALQAA